MPSFSPCCRGCVLSLARSLVGLFPQGYFRIARGINCARIEEDAWAMYFNISEIAPDAPPTPAQEPPRPSWEYGTCGVDGGALQGFLFDVPAGVSGYCPMVAWPVCAINTPAMGSATRPHPPAACYLLACVLARLPRLRCLSTCLAKLPRVTHSVPSPPFFPPRRRLPSFPRLNHAFVRQRLQCLPGVERDLPAWLLTGRGLPECDHEVSLRSLLARWTEGGTHGRRKKTKTRAHTRTEARTTVRAHV